LGPAIIWTTVAALVAAIFAELLGWHGVRTGIIVAWVVLILLVAMTRGMRWTSFLTFLSAAALAGAIVTQSAGWPDLRGWFLLAWAVLLLPVAISLMSHPMRAPAWGLFVGFWGVIGVLWLIVLQALAVAGVLTGDAYGDWTAWPLALIGIWFLVASALGLGAERFPAWVDALGLLAGAGLLAISLSTWFEAPGDVLRNAARFAGITYILWALGLALVLWGTQNVLHRFRGLVADRAVHQGSV
jgi:hypothetical protein